MREPIWYPDEDSRNADWPKRTPDTLEDIEAAIKAEKRREAKKGTKKTPPPSSKAPL